MISRMKNQKIFVQTQDESIKIELLPSLFRSLVEPFVHLRRARQKGEFFVNLVFFNIRDK